MIYILVMYNNINSFLSILITEIHYCDMIYRITGNIDVEFNLTFWWSSDQRQINIRQYEFSGYYKLLALYHFVKLKFFKCYLEINSSNLFPVNISGYMELFIIMICTNQTFKPQNNYEIITFIDQSGLCWSHYCSSCMYNSLSYYEFVFDLFWCGIICIRHCS